MTSLLEHPTASPLLAGLGALEDAVDRLQSAGVQCWEPGAYATVVQRIERAHRRLEAVKLKVLACADRSGAAADAGFTGTDAWAARHTTTPRATAAREVRLATDLQSGHDATAAALDAGLVSPAHAAVIVHAADRLPAGVSDQQRAQVETALVDKARRLDPDQLRREARRALEAIEPDQSVVDAHEDRLIRTEEEIARSRSRLTFHDNADGTVTGHFTVPATAAAFLHKIVDTMTAPRRMQASTGQEHDWDHRRGLAFTEILEHLPTDHLHPKTAATVVVTIDHSVLHGALKAAGLDTGHTISAGEARRLACTAGIIPAVLGGRSVALDLGRESRLFTEAQRLAKSTQHRTCAADGCERPYAWCELHHQRPWGHSGKTDLNNAIPLCHRHHQWIHDTAYTHRRLPDGSLRFSRRT
jgi:hypothetical protein